MDTVKRFGYVPSGAGQALARGKTETIGVYYNHGQLPSPLLGCMLQGAERMLEPVGYQLMVVSQPESRTEISKPIRQRFVDGIIIAHDRDQRLEVFLGDVKIPYVLLNVETTTDRDCVITDNKGGIWLAVEHLVSLGHSRIAFVNSMKPSSHISTKIRAEGYVEAMARAKKLAIPGYNDHLSPDKRIDQLLSLPNPPTALVCFNDDVAMFAIDYLLGKGIKVPQHISVTGCDDYNPAVRYFHPAITTLRVPFEKMGEHAAELLLTRIKDKSSPWRLEVLPQELIVRASTGPVENHL